MAPATMSAVFKIGTHSGVGIGSGPPTPPLYSIRSQGSGLVTGGRWGSAIPRALKRARQALPLAYAGPTLRSGLPTALE